MLKPNSAGETGPQPGNAGALRVVILQGNRADAQELLGFFARRGDQVWQTNSTAEALDHLRRHKPHLLLVDLHQAGHDWVELLREARQKFPGTRPMVTNRYPDLAREMLAKEQGVRVLILTGNLSLSQRPTMNWKNSCSSMSWQRLKRSGQSLEARMRCALISFQR